MSGLASRPSMLVWGERDRIVPAAHVEAARHELPDSRVEMFARSGHFPHLDEPDRFARVLDEFVSAGVGQAVTDPLSGRTG
jgi:pimeloyl-ACP methyl ester carboxylesterase